MEKNTILIIEDDKSLSGAIKSKLKNSGYESIVVNNVDDAINELKNPDAIRAVWLDHYLLGSKSGFNFLVHVRSSKNKLQNIPVFVVSNTASTDKVRAYMNLGATKYFVKAETKLKDIISEIDKLY